ncbi:hypothetical protein AVEN_269487-1 [Araneus ventricosus]|uniref:Uncharacterized protein n=1 Tax=Araneus ventricosus TaxID=182803 RepID=A0A4Y2MVF2_ARAVE|nr:hypothetical protein AVEN_269487-1 [Araneus ventricosus]
MWTSMQSNATDNYEDSSLCLLHQGNEHRLPFTQAFHPFLSRTIFKSIREFGKTDREYDIHLRTGTILEGVDFRGILYSEMRRLLEETKVQLN